MFVGIDVHKHQHAAALIDERGGELAALIVPNSPQGYRRLLDWLGEFDAGQAVVGVESPGSYGRQLVGALAAAGLEVLHVPAWRTHRERHRQGPGKTDPGDALAIADVVRRKRTELGPALQPDLVRAISMLELQRRRFVLDRTQASSGFAPTGPKWTPSPKPTLPTSPATSKTSTLGSSSSKPKSLSCSKNTATCSAPATRAPPR